MRGASSALLTLAFAGKCCCTKQEYQRPTDCTYHGPRYPWPRGPRGCGDDFKIRPNGDGTTAKDCEKFVKDNKEFFAQAQREQDKADTAALIFRELGPVFSEEESLLAAEQSMRSGTVMSNRTDNHVVSLFKALKRIGYKDADIKTAMFKNDMTSVRGCEQLLRVAGAGIEGPAAAELIRAAAAAAGPPQLVSDFVFAAAEPAAVPVTGWSGRVLDGWTTYQAGDKQVWLLDKTWSYHAPVELGTSWVRIIKPATETEGELPYFWKQETGETTWDGTEAYAEANEQAERLSSFGLTVPPQLDPRLLAPALALLETEDRIVRQVNADGF